MPTVSIVLPTYNRLPLLREAVDSVRAQTFGDWELIVLDDGSADGTVEYLRALSDEDPRIVPVPLPHMGRLPRLRNEGIRRARGGWVAFLDSDDAWRADKLQAHMDAHRAHPRARWSYSGRTIVDADGQTLPEERFVPPFQPHSGWIVHRLLTHEVQLAAPTLVMERALLREVGGQDESLAFCADYELGLRMAVRAECICLPEPLVRVRVHAASTTWRRVEVSESFIQVYRKFADAHGTAEVRRLCARQEAFYADKIARRRAEAGT
jgi:glycosyltransferase involved in cell wall biosynthesis